MGKIGTDSNIGKETRFPHNDPTKGGRKPSIRKQLEATLENEGGLTVPAKQVTKVHEDGSVTIKLPTSEQMALKLVSWAMSGKGADSIKAIQMIMEQIDGKPTQPIEPVIPGGKTLKIEVYDPQIAKTPNDTKD